MHVQPLGAQTVCSALGRDLSFDRKIYKVRRDDYPEHLQVEALSPIKWFVEIKVESS